MEWMSNSLVRLDVTERKSCVKEVEMSRTSPFTKTGGKSGLRLSEMTTCVVFFIFPFNLTTSKSKSHVFRTIVGIRSGC